MSFGTLVILYVGVVVFLWLIKDNTPEKMKKGQKVISPFGSDVCPDRLLSGTYWNFKDRTYDSYDEFVEAVKKYNRQRGVKWNPNEFVLGTEEITVQYHYEIAEGELVKELFSFYSDDMNFTSGELLYNIHNQIVEVMQYRQYTFLDYLKLTTEYNLNNPIYKLIVLKSETNNDNMDITSIDASFIERKNQEEQLLKGIVELAGGRKVEITLDPDEEEETPEVYQSMADRLKEFISYLTPAQQDEYRKVITDGIMEDAYSQSDDEPEEDEIRTFYEDLHIIKIAVYPDAFVIWYEVQGEELTMQINMPGYEIDEFYFASL